MSEHETRGTPKQRGDALRGALGDVEDEAECRARLTRDLRSETGAYQGRLRFARREPPGGRSGR